MGLPGWEGLAGPSLVPGSVWQKPGGFSVSPGTAGDLCLPTGLLSSVHLVRSHTSPGAGVMCFFPGPHCISGTELGAFSTPSAQ